MRRQRTLRDMDLTFGSKGARRPGQRDGVSPLRAPGGDVSLVPFCRPLPGERHSIGAAAFQVIEAFGDPKSALAIV